MLGSLSHHTCKRVTENRLFEAAEASVTFCTVFKGDLKRSELTLPEVPLCFCLSLSALFV